MIDLTPIGECFRMSTLREIHPAPGLEYYSAGTWCMVEANWTVSVTMHNDDDKLSSVVIRTRTNAWGVSRPDNKGHLLRIYKNGKTEWAI